MTARHPRKPHSSPMVQKMKSVLCSGTNPNVVWVPFRNPLPKRPPEPIAIPGRVVFHSQQHLYSLSLMILEHISEYERTGNDKYDSGECSQR